MDEGAVSKMRLFRCKNIHCKEVVKADQIDNHMTEKHPNALNLLYKFTGTHLEPHFRANPDNVIQGMFEEVKK
jgi:hypothetical protein